MLQRLERGRRVGASEDVVAELGGEVTENRRAQQEPARRLIERAENLVVQVVGDESMISAELAHRVVLILDAAQPEQREVEGSRPSLRSLEEHLDLVGPEVKPAPFDEQVGRLLAREGEIAGPNLGERAARAKPREVERRVGPRHHHQPRRRGQVVECVVDRVEALAIGDALEVVEHDGERRAERRDAVRQLDHGALERNARESSAAAAHRGRGRRARVRPPWPRRSRTAPGRCRRPRASPRRRLPEALSCHVRAATVFPYPGGAETSVSVTSSRSRISWTRGRATISARSLGRSSFVSAIGSVSNSTGLVIGGLVRRGSRRTRGRRSHAPCRGESHTPCRESTSRINPSCAIAKPSNSRPLRSQGSLLRPSSAASPARGDLQRFSRASRMQTASPR